jgi:hypothetical protein
MSKSHSPETILKLFESKTVVDLPTIQTAMDGASVMSVFRYLRKLPYRRSYNHNGRYYTQHDPSRYDRFGLWSYGDIYFSVDGSLKNTVRRLVYEAHAGVTHQELYECLRVRVHNTLYELLGKGEIGRERVLSIYIYLHIDDSVQKEQLKRRREQIAYQQAAAAEGKVSDQIIIQVLLTLIHHPGAKAADIVRYLQGHSPPISMSQVSIVFAHYDLENSGGKKGLSS